MISDINLDEWRPKNSDNPIKNDNDLVKIKEKMKLKQEAEMAKKREEDEVKRKKDQQWNTMTPVTSSTNNQELKEKPKENVFATENLFRPQVAIQWGQKGFKGKTPDPQTNVKKAVPFVGKMPSKKKETPDRYVKFYKFNMLCI